ncbi:MAG: hypothetical protein KJO24_03670, partial [Gammaproteobacteria bacterium]|nr:hypothetical protein [Gammaproteobacteria bacterium]
LLYCLTVRLLFFFASQCSRCKYGFSYTGCCLQPALFPSALIPPLVANPQFHSPLLTARGQYGRILLRLIVLNANKNGLHLEEYGAQITPLYFSQRTVLPIVMRAQGVCVQGGKSGSKSQHGPRAASPRHHVAVRSASINAQTSYIQFSLLLIVMPGTGVARFISDGFGL